MDTKENFAEEVKNAVASKTAWFNTTELPKVLSSYRNVKGYITNFSSVLLRKGFIQNDPYKHEKKVNSINAIADGPIADSERASETGARLSDYDNMLDYVCSYVRFSVETLSIDQIKRLVAFNNSIAWNSFSNTSSKYTTKTLAEMVNSIRASQDSMSINMTNDIISLLAKEFTYIGGVLKDLTELQKECYKLQVRTQVMTSSSFDGDKARTSAQAAQFQLRKAFTATMGKKPFYTELITELIEEEYGNNAQKARAVALERLSIPQQKKRESFSENQAHETVMGAVRLLGSVSSQFEVINQKLEENRQALQNQHNNFFHQLGIIFRRAFGLPEKPVEYRVTITESITQTTRTETVNIQSFLADIAKRTKVYASFSVRKNPGYKKIDALPDLKILEFLNTQLSECQKILILLGALDAYFKANISTSHQVKGIKIEISAMRGILQKTNQQKAEYAILAQEQDQMKKLGIHH